MTDQLTQQQAKAWANEMATNGTGDIRKLYLERFGAGSIARDLWDDPTFTLGIEYGILITVAKIYGDMDE